MHAEKPPQAPPPYLHATHARETVEGPNSELDPSGPPIPWARAIADHRVVAALRRAVQGRLAVPLDRRALLLSFGQ